MDSKHNEATEWFETLYADSKGDEEQVPWATMKTNHFLEDYLKNNLPTGKALVVGCGLGDDAIALSLSSCESVTAIDISPTAISWCKERFDGFGVDFRVEDLFALPEDLLGEFDFVFEAFTIQALPLSCRDEVITAIASLLKPLGKVLAITYGKQEDETIEGPPWPLARNELRLFENKGMNELEFSIFDNPEGFSSMKFRALYQKLI